MKNYLISILIVLSSCMCGKSSDEIELMSKDVLRAKEGIEIQIIPLPKAGKKS